MFVSPTHARTQAEKNVHAEPGTPAANLKTRERSAFARRRVGPVGMTKAAAC